MMGLSRSPHHRMNHLVRSSWHDRPSNAWEWVLVLVLWLLRQVGLLDRGTSGRPNLRKKWPPPVRVRTAPRMFRPLCRYPACTQLSEKSDQSAHKHLQPGHRGTWLCSSPLARLLIHRTRKARRRTLPGARGPSWFGESSSLPGHKCPLISKRVRGPYSQHHAAVNHTQKLDSSRPIKTTQSSSFSRPGSMTNIPSSCAGCSCLHRPHTSTPLNRAMA